ncbi:MAG: hypothetical protein K0Q73_407 [Paenibacillus sp.]|jgi:hypothetical protein|nr:hypothetical protein [Paenibacillus sp.]
MPIVDILKKQVALASPLTLMFALSQRVTKNKFRYPEEKMLIG